MNPNSLLQSLMANATRLTRSGNLPGATAAIQSVLNRALGRLTEPKPGAGAQHPAGVADIIEGQAREVSVAPPTAAAAGATPHDARDEATHPSRDTRPHADELPERGDFLRGHHAEAEGARDYKLFVPPGHAGRALPLIVMLHGCTQNPDDFARGTGMNELALAQDFFVLYPEQAVNANGNRCWNWFKQGDQQRDRGEPAVLAGMTRAVMREHAIDPRRVYVAGLSAGGAMAAILGDAYPDLFAAVGVHSGLATGAATDVGSAFAAMKGGTAMAPLAGGMASFRMPNMPGIPGIPGMPGMPGMPGQAAPAPRLGSAPPTIVFHGDGDKTVHPVNGEQVIAAALPVAGDAARAQQDRGRADNLGREYTRHLHRDSAGRTVAEHWVVHGSGHAWSGGQAQGSYTDPLGPDASQEMVRFFFDNPASAPQ